MRNNFLENYINQLPAFDGLSLDEALVLNGILYIIEGSYNQEIATIKAQREIISTITGLNDKTIINGVRELNNKGFLIKIGRAYFEVNSSLQDTRSIYSIKSVKEKRTWDFESLNLRKEFEIEYKE